MKMFWQLLAGTLGAADEAGAGNVSSISSSHICRVKDALPSPQSFENLQNTLLHSSSAR